MTLKKTISYLLLSNSLNFGIVFVSSVLVFRNINRDEYGLYIFIVSIMAIIELIMGGFNQAINRFMKEDISVFDKKQIILFTIYYKYFILVLFLMCIYVFIYFNFLESLLNEYTYVSSKINDYFLISILNNVLSILSGVSIAILSGLHHYKIINNSLLIKNCIYLSMVIGLIYVTNSYLFFLYVSLCLNLILLIYMSVVLSIKCQEYSLPKLFIIKLDLGIYKKYLLSYSTPLTTISILSYVKNHLPIIILGKEFELSDISIYSIIKKFFKTLHTIAGSFFEPLLSKFITIKNGNLNKYKIVMNNLYYGSIFLRALMYILLILLNKYFFLLFKIEQSSTNNLIYAILGFEFVIAGIMTLYGAILNTKKTTRNLLYISTMRFVFEMCLIYFILFEYGIIGAALILLLSRYFELLCAYFFIKKERVLKYAWLNIIFIFPFGIYFIYSGLFFRT